MRLSQVAPHGLVIGIIVSNKLTQVLKNLHPFQLSPVRRKQLSECLLGTYGSRILPFPLLSSLTQSRPMMTLTEILHRHL
jgi:hypothetical protein